MWSILPTVRGAGTLHPCPSPKRLGWVRGLILFSGPRSQDLKASKVDLDSADQLGASPISTLKTPSYKLIHTEWDLHDPLIITELCNCNPLINLWCAEKMKEKILPDAKRKKKYPGWTVPKLKQPVLDKVSTSKLNWIPKFTWTLSLRETRESWSQVT